MVVHRQAEQDREDQERDPALDHAARGYAGATQGRGLHRLVPRLGMHVRARRPHALREDEVGRW